MASNRHLGRIIALQSLYELTFRKDCGDSSATAQDITQRNISRYKASLDDVGFIENLVNNIEKEAGSLDERLQPIAPEWPLEQISRIDHVVLRMGAHELLKKGGAPPKVVINEAVELAKDFGGDNSSKFVNGVLGTLLRQIDPKQAAKPEKKVQAEKTDESQPAPEAEKKPKATKKAKSSKKEVKNEKA
jgi:N utilization substance protein B